MTDPNNAMPNNAAPAPNPYTQPNGYQYGGPTAPTPGAPAAVVPLDKPYYGCSFQEAFLRFWKKYAMFKGRASRSEFWWWTLANAGIVFVIDLLISISDNFEFLSALWLIATVVPSLALATRRLHDTNKAGWWLIVFYAVPFVSMIFLIIFTGVRIQGALQSARLYGDSYYGTSDGLAEAGVVLAAIVIAFLVMLAAIIVYIVFMALPSKPEGARFDADYALGNPTYGNPTYGYGYTAPYGAPMANPTAGPTTSPAMPSQSMPNGQQGTPAYPNTYAPGAAAPTTPNPYAQPTFSGTPAEGDSATDSNEQKPWQGQ